MCVVVGGEVGVVGDGGVVDCVEGVVVGESGVVGEGELV